MILFPFLTILIVLGVDIILTKNMVQIDNLLTNSLKKEFYDVANEKFIKEMQGISGSIKLGKAHEARNNDLVLQTINSDRGFELKLSEIDNNVIESIKRKINDFDHSDIQILNKGDKMVMDADYRNYDYDISLSIKVHATIGSTLQKCVREHFPIFLEAPHRCFSIFP